MSQEYQALWSARGVNKSYGANQVLKDLDLDIEPGKIYGLIGRNGAGKTTLLGILTGQNTLDSGSVTYRGERVWENPRALGEICFSRELPTTLMGSRNNLKIRNYLEAARLFLPHWDEACAQRLLADFSLSPKQKIYALSKGQRSMVTILIALASRAPVTILDEPTAGLDVVMRERFYRLLLSDFSETGRTFIISTHIIEEAAGVFEKVIFLDEGRILENAPTEELVEQFCYLSGSREAVEEACAGLRVYSRETLGRRVTAAVRCPQGMPELPGHLQVDVAPMNLQKVFVTLCGHGDEEV